MSRAAATGTCSGFVLEVRVHKRVQQSELTLTHSPQCLFEQLNPSSTWKVILVLQIPVFSEILAAVNETSVGAIRDVQTDTDTNTTVTV